MSVEINKPYDASGAEIFKKPIDAKTRIGHVHLKVADIERALAFYCGVLGFSLVTRYGAEAAFIAAGDYHHHIGLNTWESRGGSPPARGTTGLFHLAIALSHPRRAGRCVAPSGGGGRRARRRLRSRRQRGLVPARSR